MVEEERRGGMMESVVLSEADFAIFPRCFNFLSFSSLSCFLQFRDAREACTQAFPRKSCSERRQPKCLYW